jgi:hypothetical protein
LSVLSFERSALNEFWIFASFEKKPSDNYCAIAAKPPKKQRLQQILKWWRPLGCGKSALIWSKPTVFSELPDIPFAGLESPFRRGICRSLHGDWVDRHAISAPDFRS